MRVTKHLTGATRGLGLFALGLGAVSALPALAEDTKIVAVIDQARLVKIPAGAQTLVIGNPTVADVTLMKQTNVMVLTPKAFGETNFIALDENGNPLAESMIQVVAGTSSLTVQRGMDRQSYSCTPKCQPTERLGDDDKYLTAVAAQDQAHTARLATSALPAPGAVVPSQH
jgi:Flp pilus assembly secretin CpaC